MGGLLLSLLKQNDDQILMVDNEVNYELRAEETYNLWTKMTCQLPVTYLKKLIEQYGFLEILFYVLTKPVNKNSQKSVNIILANMLATSAEIVNAVIQNQSIRNSIFGIDLAAMKEKKVQVK